MKYITHINEYLSLNEGKQVGELYHWTSFISTYMILEQNYIKSGKALRDDVKTFKGDIISGGVSFTRDKFFHGWKNRHYPMESCIVIDGDKRSKKYKLFPYNDFFDGIQKPNKKEADEQETRTSKNIENIIKYIKRIELYYNDGGATEEEQLNYIKWFAPYRNTLKGFDYNNYTSINDFKLELCEYIKSKGIECIIKTVNENINENTNNINDNFWKWFGNSITIKNNTPIICYHATDTEFNTFSKDKIGKNYWQSKSNAHGGGFFFSDRKPNGQYSKYIMPVYLKIESPLIRTAGDYFYAVDMFDNNKENFFHKAKENENDGIIINSPTGSLYIVFNPNQIKSINNDGSWDLADNNIYS